MDDAQKHGATNRAEQGERTRERETGAKQEGPGKGEGSGRPQGGQGPGGDARKQFEEDAGADREGAKEGRKKVGGRTRPKHGAREKKTSHQSKENARKGEGGAGGERSV